MNIKARKFLHSDAKESFLPSFDTTVRGEAGLVSAALERKSAIRTEVRTGWPEGSTHTRSLKPQKLFGAANSFYKAGLCSDSSN